MSTTRLVALPLTAALSIASCQRSGPIPSADEARTFLAEANATMLRLGNGASGAGWVQNTYITPDTEAMAARANEAYVTTMTKYAQQAARLDAACRLPAGALPRRQHAEGVPRRGHGASRVRLVGRRLLGGASRRGTCFAGGARWPPRSAMGAAERITGLPYEARSRRRRACERAHCQLIAPARTRARPPWPR